MVGSDDDVRVLFMAGRKAIKGVGVKRAVRCNNCVVDDHYCLDCICGGWEVIWR